MKTLSAILLCIALMPCRQACASGPRPPLRFVTESLPPFTYEENGRAAGPMNEVLEEACRSLGLECVSSVLPWRRALMLAEKGEAEGIYAIVDIPERRAVFHVLRPVLQFHYTFFQLEKSPRPYAGLASLQGRIVAAYGPSASSIALQETAAPHHPAEILIERDNLTVLRKLAADRYNPDGLILMNEDVANWLLSTNGINGIRPAARIYTLAYTFGLSRTTVTPELVDRFNKALFQLCHEGFIAKVAWRHHLMPAPCN